MCYYIIRSTRESKVAIKHGSDHRRLSLAPKNNKDTLNFSVKKMFLFNKIKGSKLMRSISSPEKEEEILEKIDEEEQNSPQFVDDYKFDFTYDYENGIKKIFFLQKLDLFSNYSIIEFKNYLKYF